MSHEIINVFHCTVGNCKRKLMTDCWPVKSVKNKKWATFCKIIWYLKEMGVSKICTRHLTWTFSEPHPIVLSAFRKLKRLYSGPQMAAHRLGPDRKLVRTACKTIFESFVNTINSGHCAKFNSWTKNFNHNSKLR